MGDWLDDVLEAIRRRDEVKTKPPSRFDRMEFVGEIMSNIDRQVDLKVWDLLESRPDATYAQHSAWNFCGYVWFDGQTWHEEVWRHGEPVEVHTGCDPADLFAIVNELHGSDWSTPTAPVSAAGAPPSPEITAMAPTRRRMLDTLPIYDFRRDPHELRLADRKRRAGELVLPEDREEYLRLDREHATLANLIDVANLRVCDLKDARKRVADRIKKLEKKRRDAENEDRS